MSWIEKGQSASFEHEPIEGLYYIDGDVLATIYKPDWTKGQKYPKIAFSSGQEFDIWEGSGSPIVHIFPYGEMDLRLRDTRDNAYRYANSIAEQCGYLVAPVGDDQLELIGSDDDHFLVTYDNERGVMANIEVVEDPHPIDSQRPLPLVPPQVREILPELYSQEAKGMEARAVAKFFTPDSNYTWYATEFDGDDTLFGLVVGEEAELGYFSLSELEAIRGPLHLPVERDLYFEPKTLAELKAEHQS